MSGVVTSWRESKGAVNVTRPLMKADRVRIGVAVLALLAAAAFVTACFVRPELVRFDGNRVTLYLAGPALLLAAVVHLLLVLTGILRPLISFTRRGIAMQGEYLAGREITQLTLQRLPQAGGRAALLAQTTRSDEPSVVVVPAGMMKDEDLAGLYARVKTMYA